MNSMALTPVSMNLYSNSDTTLGLVIRGKETHYLYSNVTVPKVCASLIKGNLTLVKWC